MDAYKKSYKVTLNVIGPLFIGGGFTLSKKDYVLDIKEKKAYVLDIDKFFAFLIKRRLDRLYGAYVTTGLPLYEWLDKNGVTVKDIEGFSSYVLDLRSVDFSKDRSRDLQLFVKDAYGLPYVPGSSLKGALRTVLLGNELLKNNDRFASDKNSIGNTYLDGRRNMLSREARMLESKVFNRLGRSDNSSDMLNDMMTGLQVGDSRPLSHSDLILCQKLDARKDGRAVNLPIFRECLKPGTKVEFVVSVDSRFFPYSMEDILGAIRGFCGMYDSCFVSEFELISDREVLFLGGGVGFVSKSVVYPLFGKYDGLRMTSNILSKQFMRARHPGDISFGVSPRVRKLSVWKGVRYDMGACGFSFEPLL